MKLLEQGIECTCVLFLSTMQSTIPRFPNTEGLTSLCDVLNYTQKLVQVQSTEPATAVTALVAKQVHRDACQWVSCNGFFFFYIDNVMQKSNLHWSSILYNMQLKTVSNGLVRTCSESELAFFCTQLTLNLRNSARTTTQAGLPSSPADICEWIKNHFAMGSPERERLYNTTDC